MNKLAVIVSLAAVSGVTGLAQAASTGTIAFKGELTASTCDVVVDGQSSDATVVLPTVSANQLDAAAKTAGETGFVIALNNCTGTLKTASAYFEPGPSVNSTTGRLNNISGTATNVSLQLLDVSSPSRTVIEAGNQSQITNTTYKPVMGGRAHLPYAVRYYADDATTAGTVVSNVIYSIQYQ